MATLPAPSIAIQLERIARDVHEMAFDFMEPAHSTGEAEHRIACVEELADRLRATVRGGQPLPPSNRA